jgi:glycosyltransferase involved in cell wall biosynthesis
VRVLLVSFYFPPAGGGGVARPLKFAEQLARAGVVVHVLAPDDPRWLYEDHELRVPAGVSVHRARYIGPRGRRPAEELHGRRGLDRLLRLLMLTPRRLVIPDENVSWLTTAIPAAWKLVRRDGIDLVLTTSPPGSVQLVGYALQRLTGVRWVADLRDSLIAKSDRRYERRTVRIKERTNRPVSRLVAREAEAIVTATQAIAAEMHALGARGSVAVIPNGCDFDDFKGLVHHRSEQFRITHTGTFLGDRSALPVLEALIHVDPAIVLRFVGDFRQAEHEWANRHGLNERIQLVGHVSRRRALELQRDSEALLLLLPEGGGGSTDIPSGKLFEYLAAERPILAVAPEDGTAAALIKATGMGTVVAPGDASGLRTALEQLVQQWRLNPHAGPTLPAEWKQRLARESRVRELISVLNRVCAAEA